jgi:hypothetical protein
MNRIALALGIALAGLCPPVLAGSPLQPAIDVAAFGGDLSTPLVVGDWAYVPTGATVTAWDVGQAGTPVRRGDTRTDAVDGIITGLVRRGDYLYASWQGYQSDRAGVAVYSIADRAQPVLLASDNSYTTGTFRNLRAIALANDRLYLFDGESGVHVGLLTDPVHPTFSLGWPGIAGGYSATVFGNRIYTQGRNFIGGTQINVWDVGAPAAPQLLGGATLDGFNNFNVQFAGPLAVGFGFAVSTFDLSDPAAISELGTVESPAAYLGLVLGTMAYSFGLDGLDAWNLSTPAAPVSAGHFAIDTFAADAAAVHGNDALLLTRADRFTVVDASVPTAPVLRGHAHLVGGIEAKDIAVVGDKALIVQANYGLTTVDRASLAPLARFEVDVPQSLQGRVYEQIATAGSRAYLTSWGYGVFVLDIANPLAVQELSRVDMPFATAVVAQGNFAYVGTSTNGGILSVIDVSNPSTPVVRGSVTTSKIMKLALHGNVVFVADEAAFDVAGLRIVDISNPDAPLQVAHYTGCESVSDLALNAAGTIAYLGCNDGLHVVNVANPSAPVALGTFARTISSTPTVEVQGTRVFLGSSDPVGVVEIDVSNPALPVLVADHMLPTDPGRIRNLGDGRVAVFGGQGGIRVLAADGIFAHGFD